MPRAPASLEWVSILLWLRCGRMRCVSAWRKERAGWVSRGVRAVEVV
jgi:hypothetical protein